LGALVACALLAVSVVGSTAAADGTSPTLSVGTTPQNPTPGTDVTITATVTPGTNPDSTGLAVNCDLSWATINNSSAALFPDVTGQVFSRTVTVPSNAVPGERVGSCTASDDQGRRSSTPYSLTIAPAEADSAPTVTGHMPADGETGVAVDANLAITFSEPVDVTGAWFSIDCTSSGLHDAAVTGGPAAFLLNPNDNFAAGEDCTVTLDGSLITDRDTNDPPNALEGSPTWSFTTAAPLTFGGLCELVHSYATDPKVADDLCAKLAQAASSPTATARAGLLGAFRNQVDAKVDKGLTAEQAAELKLLSAQL
jgi:hypothetical protein